VSKSGKRKTPPCGAPGSPAGLQFGIRGLLFSRRITDLKILNK